MGEPDTVRTELSRRIKELEDRLLEEHIKPRWKMFEAAKRQIEAQEKLVFAAPDAAKILGLATSTVRAMASSGRIKVVKKAGRVGFPIAELERLKDEKAKTRALAAIARARWAERGSDRHDA